MKIHSINTIEWIFYTLFEMRPLKPKSLEYWRISALASSINSRHSGSRHSSLPTLRTARTKSLLNFTLSQFSASGQSRMARVSISADIRPSLCSTGNRGNIRQARGRSFLLQLPPQTQSLKFSAFMVLIEHSSFGKRRIPVVVSPLQQAASQSTPQSLVKGVSSPKIAYALPYSSL